MRRQMEKIAWAMVGSAVTLGIALTYGVATGQQPGGPPPPGFGPGGPGGPGGGGTVVRGTIAEKSVENNAVLVKTDQGTQWVQLPQGVTIRRQVGAALTDVKVKDTLTVTGTPTAIEAAGIQLTDAQAGQAGPGGFGPGGPGGPGGFGPGGPRGGGATVSGTVESLDPLTITSGTTKISVATKEATKVSRVTQVSVDEIPVGEQFMAFGQPDERNVVQARSAMGGQVDGMFGGFGPAAGGRAGNRRGMGGTGVQR